MLKILGRSEVQNAVSLCFNAWMSHARSHSKAQAEKMKVLKLWTNNMKQLGIRSVIVGWALLTRAGRQKRRRYNEVYSVKARAEVIALELLKNKATKELLGCVLLKWVEHSSRLQKIRSVRHKILNVYGGGLRDWNAKSVFLAWMMAVNFILEQSKHLQQVYGMQEQVERVTLHMRRGCNQAACRHVLILWKEHTLRVRSWSIRTTRLCKRSLLTFWSTSFRQF